MSQEKANQPDDPSKAKSASNAMLDREDETAHLDDTVIGRAFRWSLAGLALLCVVVAGTVVYARRKPAPIAPKLTTLSAPAAVARVEAEIPTVKFTDVTAASGVHFVHNNGAYGDKLLPETMGGGVAFLDFD